jgi:hypothetical protein
MRCRLSGNAMSGFQNVFRRLPIKIFELFKRNPRHPSLGFRKKGSVYTAEIGRTYRALACERKGHYYWFWIGTHEDYNNFKL